MNEFDFNYATDYMVTAIDKEQFPFDPLKPNDEGQYVDGIVRTLMLVAEQDYFVPGASMNAKIDSSHLLFVLLDKYYYLFSKKCLKKFVVSFK